MSVTASPIGATSSEKSRKRKSTQEDSKARKRSRQDDHISEKSKGPVVKGQLTPSDAIVTLRSSRISAIVLKKKSLIRLKFSLPSSVQRIWLCSQSEEPVIEYVAYISSSISNDAVTYNNDFRDFGPLNEAEAKFKYRYLTSGISQLQSPLKFAQLRDKGLIGELPTDFQLLEQDLVVYLLSKPKKHVYGHDPQSGVILDAAKDGSAQTEAIEQADDQLRSPINKSGESPFQSQTVSLYVPLPPVAQLYPLTGLCAEHISPLLLNYYKPLKGVILAYSNPRISMELPILSENIKGQGTQYPQQSEEAKGEPFLARVHNEYAVSSMWLTVDLILLRPGRQCFVTGWINLITESHVGLICWNLFSANIPAYYLPNDWRWVESRAKEVMSSVERHRINGTQRARKDSDVAEGYFEDSCGKRVEGWLTFRVENFDITSVEKYGEKGFISLQGSLLNEGEVRQTFDETEITHTTQERSFVGLASPEINTTKGRKSENITDRRH